MKYLLSNVLAITMAFTLSGQTQSAPATPAPHGKTSAVRVVRSDATSGHLISDCFLVLPDGRYRREHTDNDPDSFSRMQVPGQAKMTYVFEGRLAPEEQENAFAMFDRAEFRALHSPEKLHTSSQFLEVTVLRQGERAQVFKLSASADFKPNQQALDPLFDWMKAMAKRKHDVSKEQANSCAVPAYVAEQVQQK